MNIVDWQLSVDCRVGDKCPTLSLTYRGNDNIIVQSDNFTMDADGKAARILVPRHLIEKFIEMIKGE